MEFLMVVCAAIAVVAMILSFLFLRLVQQNTEKAVSFADDARLFADESEAERRRVLTIKGEVEQRVIGLEAWAKSFVEKLESERKCANDELRARQVDCDYSVMLAADKAKQTADIAEVVKIEVAKIETLIAKLNKDRAENPPFVAITYGEESGEPEKAQVTVDQAVANSMNSLVSHWHSTLDKETRDMIANWKGDPLITDARVLPNGQPFEFKPTQVHPVVTEGGE